MTKEFAPDKNEAGAHNDGLMLNALKSLFRLSTVLLDL